MSAAETAPVISSAIVEPITGTLSFTGAALFAPVFVILRLPVLPRSILVVAASIVEPSVNSKLALFITSFVPVTTELAANITVPAFILLVPPKNTALSTSETPLNWIIPPLCSYLPVKPLLSAEKLRAASLSTTVLFVTTEPFPLTFVSNPADCPFSSCIVLAVTVRLESSVTFKVEPSAATESLPNV